MTGLVREETQWIKGEYLLGVSHLRIAECETFPDHPIRKPYNNCSKADDIPIHSFSIVAFRCEYMLENVVNSELLILLDHAQDN